MRIVRLKPDMKCQYEGCDKPATTVACGRQGYGEHGGHPKPAAYCADHAEKVVDEGNPEYADIERQVAELRALTATDEPVPERMQVPAVYGREQAVKGWDYHAVDGGAVYPCWTTNVTHWRNWEQRPGPHTSGSQQGVRLFATKRDALVALRAAMRKRYAETLARIDAQIAKETP